MAKVADRAAVENYVQMVASGKEHTEAFLATHPKCNAKGNTLAKRAHDFHHLPEVQDRLEEVLKETGDKWGGFRDELIGYLTEEIRNSYKEFRSLSPVMKQVEQVSKILGLEKQKVDINANIGAMSMDSANEKVNFLIAAAGRVGK